MWLGAVVCGLNFFGKCVAVSIYFLTFVKI